MLIRSRIWKIMSYPLLFGVLGGGLVSHLIWHEKMGEGYWLKPVLFCFFVGFFLGLIPAFIASRQHQPDSECLHRG